jgi:hypothetical protein
MSCSNDIVPTVRREHAHLLHQCLLVEREVLPDLVGFDDDLIGRDLIVTPFRLLLGQV